MDKSLLKIIILIAAFNGALGGVLTVIPFAGQVAFWILLCFASVIEMVFLIKTRVLNLYTIQESITIGAIIGFVSFMVFCIVYVPIVIILMKVFNYYSNYGIAVMLGAANFGIVFILSVFMAVLSATINAFTGILTFYGKDFFNNLDNNQKNKHENYK